MPLLAITPKPSVSEARFGFVLRTSEINGYHQMRHRINKLHRLKYHFIKSVQQFISHKAATIRSGQCLVNTDDLSRAQLIRYAANGEGEQTTDPIDFEVFTIFELIEATWAKSEDCYSLLRNDHFQPSINPGPAAGIRSFT